MKKIINRILILLLIVGVSSCGKDYFEVNTPSDAVDFEDLGMKDLMGPAIYSTIVAQYSTERTFGNYSQYFGSYGFGASGKTHNAGAWSQIYLHALPNIKAIMEKADDAGASHFKAVAEVLLAVNMALAADSWGNVPYTDATKGTNVVHPSFDSQEQVYNTVILLLKGAITALDVDDNSAFSLGSEDLIYKGDIEMWKKAAYTLLARYQLHLVNRGKASYADVINSVDNGFTSNDEDFQMSYPSDKNNPWFSTEILSRNTGNFHHAPNDQLISLMNGTTYPFSGGTVTEDPRLSVHFVKENAEAGDPWRGFMNGGDGESSDGEDANTYFKAGAFHTSSTSPIVLVTFSEAMFIKAEAEFLNAGGNTSSTGANAACYNAYKSGIQANMEKLGINATDYLAEGSIDLGENAIMLHNIMREKYISNLLNVETYNDLRRYGFSNEVFKGLELRLESDTEAEYLGKWFHRAEYPTSELNSNETVVLKNKVTLDTPVWWAE